MAALDRHRPDHAVRRAAAAQLHPPCVGGPGGAAVPARAPAIPRGLCAGGNASPSLDVPAGAAVRIVGDGVAPDARRCHVLVLAPRRTIAIARKPVTDPSAKPAAKRRSPVPAPALAEVAKAPGTPRKKAAAAGPRVRKPAEPAAAPADQQARLDQLQAVIVESLEADKAEEVVMLDLAGRAAFTDRMVIATGLADRQISAMATHLEEKLSEAGVKRVQVEGAGGSDWVLIDAGDIVVHLFKPDARTLYALERMWGAELDEAEAQATLV